MAMQPVALQISNFVWKNFPQLSAVHNLSCFFMKTKSRESLLQDWVTAKMEKHHNEAMLQGPVLWPF